MIRRAVGVAQLLRLAESLGRIELDGSPAKAVGPSGLASRAHCVFRYDCGRDSRERRPNASPTASQNWLLSPEEWVRDRLKCAANRRQSEFGKGCELQRIGLCGCCPYLRSPTMDVSN